MSGPYELHCPKCRKTFGIEPDSDFCWHDDVADETTTPCPGCGAALVVVAEREVYFSVELAEKTL